MISISAFQRRVLTVGVAAALAVPCVHAQKWNLSDLPAYQPGQKFSGTLRNFGSALGGTMAIWEKGFQKYQPDVQFDDHPNTEGAVPGLVCGVADLGSSGREPVLQEWETFATILKSDLVEIIVATGNYEKKTTWSDIVLVNKDNPITQLTMKQLDGIFGAQRTGGFEGFKWVTKNARSAKEDIRTWGQLGLTGEWADKEIQTYGSAFDGITNYFQWKVFHGGDKWNPNYRQYLGRDGIAQMLADVSNDKYGIVWNSSTDLPKLKEVAIAAKEGGPYVMPSSETMQNRTYPLTRNIYIFIKHPPGQPLEPKLKEFLRYILSRQGQEDVVQSNQYLPLNAELVREGLAKLE